MSADAANGGGDGARGSEEQTDELAQASPALSPTPATPPGDFAGTERYEIIRTLGAGGRAYCGVVITRSNRAGGIQGRPTCTRRVRPPEPARTQRATGALGRPLAITRSGQGGASAAALSRSRLRRDAP